MAQQVVIRGEDPGEFELYRDRMLEDLGPVGSWEGLLAERVAHLGWRLRRAERLESAGWATLEAEHVAKATAEPAELARPEGVNRHEGEPQAEEESVLARVIVADFGDARLLDRLLGYERRIENSLYRTVGELQKHKRWHEREAAAEPAMDAVTTMGEETTRKGERFFAPTKREDELRSSEELGRGRPSYEEASHDATTNTDPAVDPAHHSSIPSFQSPSLCPSCQTKPIGDGEDPSCAGPFSRA